MFGKTLLSFSSCSLFSFVRRFHLRHCTLSLARSTALSLARQLSRDSRVVVVQFDPKEEGTSELCIAAVRKINRRIMTTAETFAWEVGCKVKLELHGEKVRREASRPAGRIEEFEEKNSSLGGGRLDLLEQKTAIRRLHFLSRRRPPPPPPLLTPLFYLFQPKINK